MNIKAKANIDNVKLDCVGSIEIHSKRKYQAYITWQFFNGDKLIVSKSDNFFYREEEENEVELINKVLKKIEEYKIRRKKIFEDIEIFY
ncbi:MAG: hypothetical protein U0U67_13640 [Chitinophagales bacterium]